MKPPTIPAAANVIARHPTPPPLPARYKPAPSLPAAKAAETVVDNVSVARNPSDGSATPARAVEALQAVSTGGDTHFVKPGDMVGSSTVNMNMTLDSNFEELLTMKASNINFMQDVLDPILSKFQAAATNPFEQHAIVGLKNAFNRIDRENSKFIPSFLHQVMERLNRQ